MTTMNLMACLVDSMIHNTQPLLVVTHGLTVRCCSTFPEGMLSPGKAVAAKPLQTAVCLERLTTCQHKVKQVMTPSVINGLSGASRHLLQHVM